MTLSAACARRKADRDADENRQAPGQPRDGSPKIAGGGRNRAAAYELAIASGRNYKPGDQISYYIIRSDKKRPAYESAKLASDFDPENRDENVDYYIAKLDDLLKKVRDFIGITPPGEQETLAL